MPKPVPFPSHVRLAGTNYSLDVEPSSGRLCEKYAGTINHTAAAITIDGQAPAHSQRKTLLHELVHAADKLFGSDEMTEEQVLSLENGLWAIFNDNPGLARAIFQENA